MQAMKGVHVHLGIGCTINCAIVASLFEDVTIFFEGGGGLHIHFLQNKYENNFFILYNFILIIVYSRDYNGDNFQKTKLCSLSAYL